MIKDETLRMALDALEYIENYYMSLPKVGIEAIKACKEALAQPEPELVECQYGNGGYACCEGGPCKAEEQNESALVNEPVAKVAEIHLSRYTIEWVNGPLPEGTPLYTYPKEWKDLTDEEIEKMRHLIDWTADWSYGTFARAIEAKLKQKNT